MKNTRKLMKPKVPMNWENFRDIVSRALEDGNTATLLLKTPKGNIYLHADFHSEKPKKPSKSEVRIPCLVVPPSPFQVEAARKQMQAQAAPTPPFKVGDWVRLKTIRVIRGKKGHAFLLSNGTYALPDALEFALPHQRHP